MIDRARIDALHEAAREVADEHNRQKRARFSAAIEYGRLLRLVRDCGRRTFGRKWADRIWSAVMNQGESS